MNTNCQRTLILSVLILLGFTSLVQANPVSISPYPFLVLPILLLLEGLILIFLSRSSSLYRIRFIFVWSLITFITFIFLFILLGFLTAMTGDFLAIIIGEILVILIEARILFQLLAWPFLARNPSARPGFSKIFLYSFIANLASFLGGVLSVYLPVIADFFGYKMWPYYYTSFQYLF